MFHSIVGFRHKLSSEQRKRQILKRRQLRVELLEMRRLLASDWYVSATGTASGNGSMIQPWSLSAALADNTLSSSVNRLVQPGDTIWLLGGNYTTSGVSSRLRGSDATPIVVKNYQDQRVTINHPTGHGITVDGGGDVWFVGLEFNGASTIRYSSQAGSHPSDIPYGGAIVVNNSDDIKIINCVIHDGLGVGAWSPGTGTETTGNLIYYAGWKGPDRTHGHGLYSQNQTGTKKFIDNMIFYNGNHGIHAYGSSAAHLNNFVFEGNTLFNNGELFPGEVGRNFLLGGGNGVHSATVQDNMIYRRPATVNNLSSDFMIGFDSSGVNNSTIRNNYVVGNPFLAGAFNNVNFSANTIYGTPFSDGGSVSARYPSNQYLSSRPTGTRAFLRPNLYDVNRANLTIYNWDLLNTVSVDVSAFNLRPGDQYAIRNALNYYGDVITGTYTGGLLNIPMTGRTVAAPVGLAAPPTTFPEFGAFVLTKIPSGGGPIDTTPPIISSVFSSNLTSTSARIGWNTDEPSDSRVEYGTSISYGSTSPLDTALVNNHVVNFTGLSPNTTYQYRVISRDASGNTRVSGNFTFTTGIAINQPPTLSSVSALTGGVEDTPFTIAYTTLASAANEADPDGNPISFRIESVTSGSLTKNGAAAVPGNTLLSFGEAFVWTPAVNANGSLSSFTIRAWDGQAASSSAVPVTINVAAVNDPPTLTTIATLTGAFQNNPYSIGYAVLAGAANEADVDSATLAFRVDAVTRGSLTKNGVPVVPGSTILALGDTLSWIPPTNALGDQPAFTVRASDGQAVSATSVQVNVSVGAIPISTLPSGALANYEFHEGGGTIANDSSGNRRTASLVNGPTWSSTLSGTALNFDGVNDHVAIANGADLNLSDQSFTLSARIKTGTTTDAVILKKYSAAGAAAGYLLSVDGGSNGGRLRLQISSGANGGAGLRTFKDSRQINDDQWHDVAVTVERGVATKFYIDGVLSTVHSGNNTGNLNNTDGFSIANTSYYYGGYFRGLLDNIRLFGRALNSPEVASLVVGGAPIDTTPPVISGVAVSNITSNTSQISWNTNEASDSRVEYGTTTGYGSTTSLDAAFVNNRIVNLTGLNPNTTYHYRVISRDPSGNTQVSGNFTFATLATVNRPPTLSSVSTLSSGIEDTPFTIAYTTLASAANEADPDGNPISFRVESLTNGSLTKNGAAVVPGSTLLSFGEAFVWTPAVNANGLLSGFTIRAWDGQAASSTAVPVTMNVTAVNDPPTLTSVATLTGAIQNTPYSISYDALANAANEADVDNSGLVFRIEAVTQGSLSKNGLPVVAGSTLIFSGATLSWTPPTDAIGDRPAFTVRVSDGQATSATPVQVTVAVQSATTTLPAGAIANYEFNDGSGAIASDSSGNSRTANLVNGPSWVSTLGGTALSFDGVNDHVAIANGSALNISDQSFTLSARIKTGTTTDAVILKKYNAAGAAAGYLLAVDGGSNAGRLRLQVSSGANGGAGLRTFKDSRSINDNQWHDVAVTVERGVATKFYVDGILSTVHSSNNTGNLTNNDGFSIANTSYYYGGYFRGQIDNVRLYGRALNDSEVAALGTSVLVSAFPPAGQPEASEDEAQTGDDYWNYTVDYSPTAASETPGSPSSSDEWQDTSIRSLFSEKIVKNLLSQVAPKRRVFDEAIRSLFDVDEVSLDRDF